MKTFITIILSSILATATYASGGDSKDIHSEFAKKKGAFSMSFSKETIDAFDLDFDWQETLKSFKGDFETFQLLIISDSAEGTKNHTEILNQFKKTGYKIIDLEDTDQDFIVLTDKRKKKFNEIHILSRGTSEIVLISIYGSFEITNKD